MNLLQAEKIEERAMQHFVNPERMSYFKKLGSSVRALYGDDENPVEWYDAVVDRVITRDDESNQVLRYPKFVVTFPEYGNTEVVSLGEMDMPTSGDTWGSDRDRGRDHDGGRADSTRPYGGRDYDDRGSGRTRYEDRGYGNRDHRGGDDRWERGGRSSNGGSSKSDLYEEVRRRERDTVTTNSRNGVARRPPSTKSIMAASDSRRQEGRHRSKSPSPPRDRSRSKSLTPPPSPPRKRTAEEVAAIRAKKQKLLAKYG